MQGRPDQTALGIGLITGSVLLMAFADAVVKRVSGDLTLWQIFVARSALALPCLLGLAQLLGSRLRLYAPGWALLRSVLLVLTWLVYYASLPVLSLSVAAVAVYTNPIITALLSALMLRERVLARQWLGVALGFLGVLAILRPGTEDFSWAVLLPLLGAVLYSLAMILTRSKCAGETPIALALCLHGSFVLAGLTALAVLALLSLSPSTAAQFPFLLRGWPAMSLTGWGVMAGLALLSAIYFMGVARAYQIAPPQVIGTFDYMYLVSAALWGVVFFAETPDATTLIGMVLITAAGLLVALRPR